MKKTISIMTFLVSCLLLSQFGCDGLTGNTEMKETAQGNPAKVFEVHLQWVFSQTPVKVFIDNSQLFSDTVSSSSVVGVAKIIPVSITNGLHSLRVALSNSLTKDTLFTIQDTMYIGVKYNKQNSQIEYSFTRMRFLYD